MMVVPWVLLLVVIVVAAGMICWFKTSKKGTHILPYSLKIKSTNPLQLIRQTWLIKEERKKVCMMK